MPIHDWTRVDAGIFHAFHHEWISSLAHVLNNGLLPDEYYALPEQFTSRFGPDVLTLQTAAGNGDSNHGNGAEPRSRAVALSEPRLQPTAETDMAFYRRKQKAVVIRHVSGDDVVAVIEIVSPGNKSGRSHLRAVVEKAAQLLENGVHLLILDLQPPRRYDPHGIHAEIWLEIDGSEYLPPADKPLTLASYDASLSIRAYVVNVAVGDKLPDMPLFLSESQVVEMPLETTYQVAFAEIPSRWRRVLEASPT